MTIKEFIEKNNLSFAPGQRNNDSLVLAGWLCHIGKTGDDIDDILVELEDAITDYNSSVEIEIEFERVFRYALINNYGAAWESDHYKSTYNY